MNNGDKQAFPDQHSSGLTKREYFAAMALTGLLSNEAAMRSLSSAAGRASVYMTEHQAASLEAVNHADALLKALENE